MPEVSVQKSLLDKGDLNVTETGTTAAVNVHASEDENRDAVTTPDQVNIETDGQHSKRRRTTKSLSVKGNVDFDCRQNFLHNNLILPTIKIKLLCKNKHTFILCYILKFIDN